MSGFYLMHRGWMDNPVFGNEPMSERTAWVWMIEAAAFKPTRRRVGGKIMEVGRGQIVGSIRFLAEAWGWSKSKVDRFLHRLRCEGMIGTETEQGTSLITICNYEKYQALRDADETAGGTVLGQERDSSGTNKNEDKEDNQNKDSYVWEGRLIRVKRRQFQDWLANMPTLGEPGIRRELIRADAYYAEKPPKGSWLFPVTSWLVKAEQQAAGDKRAASINESW